MESHNTCEHAMYRHEFAKDRDTARMAACSIRSIAASKILGRKHIRMRHMASSSLRLIALHVECPDHGDKKSSPNESKRLSQLLFIVERVEFLYK